MSAGLPPAAHAAALAGFERMSVHRLLALLRHHAPEHALAIAVGDAPPPPDGLIAKVLTDHDVRAAWRRSGLSITPASMWERCGELGLDVSYVGGPGHPRVLAADPLPPPVLFSRGDRSLLDGRRVALVGTRNATAAGRHVARKFGDGLARLGVNVVSGLARGIDGEAHAGTLAGGALGGGGPIAVVASGLDVVYPKEHRRLWQQVAERGVLLSESPPGTTPLAHLFPLRNRVIAGLAEVVVVVESRERGGSLITAALAAERGIPVMAVPGSATSRAALGVNALLRDGSAPALDIQDVLVALEIDHRRVAPDARTDARPRPRRDDIAVYRACAERASTIGELAERTGRALIEVAMSLARLEQAGWLAQADGWFEVTGWPLP